MGVHDGSRLRAEQAILRRSRQCELSHTSSVTDFHQFEVQLREYSAIAAAQKSIVGVPSSAGMHKRHWDGEGEISDRPAPGRKRALSMDIDED